MKDQKVKGYSRLVSKESFTSPLQEVFDVNCLDVNYNIFELFWVNVLFLSLSVE